jgi:hypothetical protein
MMKLITGKQPWSFFWIEIWDKWVSRDKWWTIRFIILSKFEINNKKNGMVICQWFTLIDNTESFFTDEKSC